MKQPFFAPPRYVHPTNETTPGREATTLSANIYFVCSLLQRESSTKKLSENRCGKHTGKVLPWRKLFHIGEATFRLTNAPTSGLENFSPNRWYPSEWVIRTMRARRVRAARGRPAVEASGALGISSEMLEEGFKERRTATRAPPALMFSAVENSRN